MASVQQVQGVAKFSDKEKATVQKAVKEAQGYLANNNNNAKERQLVSVAGVIANAQPRPLVLTKTHDWKGHFMVNPSERIGGEANGMFVHEGANSQGQLPVVVGSKGAVVYTTFDKAFPGLGYLLAWYKPENSTIGISKVYVEAGDSGKFVKMDWNEIEAKLDASATTSCYKDANTGATAAAEIIDCGEKEALIGAVFDRQSLIKIPQVLTCNNQRKTKLSLE